MHAHNLIYANKFGAVVFSKFELDTWKGATIRGIKPNPITGKEFQQQIGSKSHGFTLGSPNAKALAIVESPLEVISYNEIFGQQVRVTSSSGIPSPELLANLATQATAKNLPVLLAFDNDIAGERHAQVSETSLTSAKVKVERQPPPAFHQAAKGWNDLLRAQRGFLWHYKHVAVQTVKEAFQAAQTWLQKLIQEPPAPKK
jgi:hypothetical protein